MKYKITTAVSTEPITLAEVKLHLRLSSDSLSEDMDTDQSIAPGVHVIAASYGLIGSAVEVLGKLALVNLNAGICGGSVLAKIQESDDNLTWLDWTGGAFTTVTSANDESVQSIDYTGMKQYIRVVATISGASCSFGVDVITLSGNPIEDSWFEDVISSAREYCENITGRGLATQTITAYMDRFPCEKFFELPRSPLQSVTSISYKDSNGTTTTMTVNTDYLVDTDSDVGRIVLPYGGSWPSFTAWPVNPISIVFIAGYTTIPKLIKQAMYLLIGFWNENREAATAKDVSKEIAFSVSRLLSQHRTGWF